MASIYLSTILLSFLCLFLNFGCGEEFRDETNRVVDQTNDDIVAGFGDFNGDKLIDIFVIKESGRSLDVLLGVQDKKYNRRTLINDTIEAGKYITGLIPADFDNDLQMDLLLILSDGKSDPKKFVIYWGSIKNISVDETNPYEFPENYRDFKDQPMLFVHSNYSNLILLATLTNGSKVLLTYAGNQTFSPSMPFSSDFELKKPHSSAFISFLSPSNTAPMDVCTFNLVLTLTDKFAVISNYTYDKKPTEYSFPDKAQYTGQSSFADFNRDGRIDHIVPVCDSKDCKSGTFNRIYVMSPNGQPMVVWDSTWDSESGGDKVGWRFDVGPWSPASQKQIQLYSTLHVGDYDNDGYPDLLTVMIHSDGRRKALLLRNVRCKGPNADDGCDKFHRQFEIKEVFLRDTKDSTVLATFFDVNDDGTLDIILNREESSTANLTFLQNLVALDSCFLKVTGGICYGNCPGNRNPYSVNIPGPTVEYSITSLAGEAQKSKGGQLSQSAHFALQLPFVMFGIGETPNFVDEIDTTIPTYGSKVRRKEWKQQIIPNSQLIVIPYPLDDLTSWKMQLFVTPSRKIYQTGFWLLGTCGLLAIIVAVLQWREMREDAQEKRQESQKFHFDAM